MPRFTAVLPCSLLAGVLVAAPAPLPKPWVSGWDRPVDPLGDCRFDRVGDRLTITVPGKGHCLRVKEGRLDAPRLLRDAGNDFSVEVRVEGAFGHPGAEGARQAGILVTGDGIVLTLVLAGGAVSLDVAHPTGLALGFPLVEKGVTESGCAYLRLERRERRVVAKWSKDGKEWQRLSAGECSVAFPEKVKVGVVAESGVGPFLAKFDRFKLVEAKR